MVVTLVVSKLSGWLNADAVCRESKGGHTVWSEVRAGRQGAADDRSARSVQEGLDCRLGVGHGEERAWNMELMSVTVEVSKVSSWLKAFASRNMPLMSVTLEVSKLSGWLNADALYRESKAGSAVQGEVYGPAGGRRRATTPRRRRKV